jgi:hypothetical protein
MVHPTDQSNVVAEEVLDLFGNVVQNSHLPKAPSPKMSSGDKMLRIAQKFATTDMFHELKALAGLGSCSIASQLKREVAIQTVPELSEDASSAPVEVEVDEVELEAVDLGPEDQLIAEQKAWYPDEQEIITMHEWCLMENLSFLYSKDKKPSVAEEKCEIIEWIFATDVIGDKSVREIPFSFVNCCIACGVRAEQFRAQIMSLPEIRKFLVEMRFCRESKLPPLMKKVHYSGPDAPDHPVYQFGW